MGREPLGHQTRPVGEMDSAGHLLHKAQEGAPGREATECRQALQRAGGRELLSKRYR